MIGILLLTRMERSFFLQPLPQLWKSWKSLLCQCADRVSQIMDISYMTDSAGVVMHHRLLGNDVRIVGQPLVDWQSKILEALDLLPYYMPIERPTRFRKILCTTMVSLHLRYPTRFARTVFDLIRFRLGDSGASGGERVFLSRGTSTKRILRNRRQVEDTARRLGFDVICTDNMPFEEQVRRMAAARFIVGEAGAGFANIGFCEAGASILEILPFSDPWMRGACFQFGHRWHGFFPIREFEQDDGRPDWERITFSVDCDEFSCALETITKVNEIAPPPRSVFRLALRENSRNLTRVQTHKLLG